MNHRFSDPSASSISTVAIELLDQVQGLGIDDCWHTCLSQLDSLGVNSVFYGFYTSKTEVERQGLTKACHFRTNHNPQWIDQMGGGELLDQELTTELFSQGVEEVIWSDESVWCDATPGQMDQADAERDLGMDVGVTLQLTDFSHASAAGVGLCMRPISKTKFHPYWEQHRSEIQDVCHVLDFNMRSEHMVEFMGLSPRELEFLTLLASGFSQKQIAYKWKRSTHTLDHHSRSCRLKLKAGNLEQSVYKAYVLGLIQP